MKTLPGKRKVSGLTLIELLVVIAVIAILAAMLLPTHSGPRRAISVMCMSNQKQIAIALIMFQDDHGGKYPWQVPATNNGSLELVSNGLASVQFLTIATNLGNRSQILICPMDKSRQAATNFSRLTNTNISYFLNLDAVTNMKNTLGADSILSGDRNLEFALKQINSGIFVQTTNTMLKWSEGFHGSPNKRYGIFAFADGHAQSVRQEDLNKMLNSQPFATNRFCFP